MSTLLSMPYGLTLPAGLMLLFFLWGFFAARARGRSGIMWGLASAVTLFIGIAVLYGLGQRLDPDASEDQSFARQDLHGDRLSDAEPPSASRHAEAMPAQDEADRRWQYMCEYHPEVSKALAAVAPLGGDAVQELKMAHLAINDSSVLPDIVQRLNARFGKPGTTARYAAAAGTAATVLAPATAEIDDDDAEPVTLVTALAYNDRDPGARSSHANLAERAVPPSFAASFDSLRVPPVSVVKPASVTEFVTELENIDDDPIVAPDRPPAHSAPINAMASSSARTSNSTFSRPPDPIRELDPVGTQNEDLGAIRSRSSQVSILEEASEAARTPDRTNVTPDDLNGARFLETHSGVHLFGLADGRVFVDRHEARPSLELARQYVDQIARRRAIG